MSKKTTQKHGPLSAQEKQYIEMYSALRSSEVIAGELKRNPRTIRLYIKEHALPACEGRILPEDDRKILRSLYQVEWWENTKDQLTEKESTLFESQWIRLYKQFDNDVLPSEEIQIRKYITLGIMMDRIMKRIKQTGIDMENLQSQYEKEVAYQYSLDPGQKDMKMAQNLMAEISAIRSAGSNLNSEYLNLAKQHESIESKMSASRDLRVKSIQDGSKTWSNVLRLLEDPKIRKDVGQHIEIMRVAREKEMKRLTKYHKFVDDEYDRPFLSGKLEELYEENDNEKSSD